MVDREGRCEFHCTRPRPCYNSCKLGGATAAIKMQIVATCPVNGGGILLRDRRLQRGERF